MASGIPTRRTTRVTRATAPSIGDENAVSHRTSKSSAAATAAKDAQNGPSKPSTSSRSTTTAAKPSAKDVGAASSTAGGASTTANGKGVLGTRKRAAFGEVTNKNGPAGAAGAAGGSKGGASKVEKKSTTASTTARAPRRTRASTAAEIDNDDVAVKVEDNDEGGASSRPIAVRKRATTSTTTVVGSSTTVSNAASTSNTNRTRRPAAGASTSRSRVASTSTVKREALDDHLDNNTEEVDDDAVAVPAKRARTSSPFKAEAPEPVSRNMEVEVKSKQSLKEALALAQEVADTKPAKDEGWQDLDAEDDDDPMMVNEYVRDIFIYMQKLEIDTLPNPEYMSNQPELQWKMRGILVDWLIEVHGKFRLLPETLFLAVNLVDRFLSARTISLVKLQLVGTTALFVASKYEEVICPSVQNFLYMADGGYGDEEILGAERYLLQTLEFNLSYPNPIHFLRRISKADNYDIQTRTVAKYFMEISCVDHKMLHLKPSLIAAGAAWLARLVLDRGEWNANLVHYSSFSEEELLPAAQLMVNYILRPAEKQAECFVKKYASKKYMKASTYVRDWALMRYTEDGVRSAAPRGMELAYDVAETKREEAL